MTKLISFLIAVQFISFSVAHAFPTPPIKNKSFHAPSTFTEDYDFDGIAVLSNCSGSLVRFQSSKETDHAMILTNGHCLESGMPDPGTFVSNESSSRSFMLLKGQAQNAGRVKANKIIYSTMTGTDITIYQLEETYSEILTKYGVHPYLLGLQHPKPATEIKVVSGYWHRGYSCAVETFAYLLKEDAYTMRDSVRYTRPGCEIIGGTSGSPVIESGTRVVIAINNTINESGEKCTMDNPCEVDANGKIFFKKGYGYAQETYIINSCVNTQGQFDLATQGCLLLHNQQYKSFKRTRVWKGSLPQIAI